jgi:hypothetical protein
LLKSLKSHKSPCSISKIHTFRLKPMTREFDSRNGKITWELHFLCVQFSGFLRRYFAVSDWRRETNFSHAVFSLARPRSAGRLRWIHFLLRASTRGTLRHFRADHRPLFRWHWQNGRARAHGDSHVPHRGQRTRLPARHCPLHERSACHDDSDSRKLTMSSNFVVPIAWTETDFQNKSLWSIVFNQFLEKLVTKCLVLHFSCFCMVFCSWLF